MASFPVRTKTVNGEDVAEHARRYAVNNFDLIPCEFSQPWSCGNA